MYFIRRYVQQGDYPIFRSFPHESQQAILGIVADFDEGAAPLPGSESRSIVPQSDQPPVELRRFVRLASGQRVPVEKGERVVVTELLPRVNQRQRLRQQKRQGRHDPHGRPQADELATAPGVLVMIRSEHQPQSPGRDVLPIGIEILPNTIDPALLLRHVVHQVIKPPGIRRVESPVEQVILLGFGQQEQVGFHRPQPPCRLLPKFDGNQHRHIAAKTVHPVFRKPKTHGVDLSLPDGPIGVIKLGRVIPPVRNDGPARSVPLVPVGRTFREPAGIARSVIGHPIDQDLHSQGVSPPNKSVEIGHRPEFGIDSPVIPNRIIGAQRSLATDLPNGIMGHQPNGIDAQIPQKTEPFRSGGKRSLGRRLPQIHLVQHGIPTPHSIHHIINRLF